MNFSGIWSNYENVTKRHYSVRITKFFKHFIQVDLQISKWSYLIITKTAIYCCDVWCGLVCRKFLIKKKISNLKIERYCTISADLLWSRSYSFLFVGFLWSRNFSTFSIFRHHIFYFNFTTSVLCRFIRRLFV